MYANASRLSMSLEVPGITDPRKVNYSAFSTNLPSIKICFSFSGERILHLSPLTLSPYLVHGDSSWLVASSRRKKVTVIKVVSPAYLISQHSSSSKVIVSCKFLEDILLLSPGNREKIE